MIHLPILEIEAGRRHGVALGPQRHCRIRTNHSVASGQLPLVAEMAPGEISVVRIHESPILPFLEISHQLDLNL